MKGFIFNFSVKLCSLRLISFPATIWSLSVETEREEEEELPFWASKMLQLGKKASEILRVSGEVFPLQMR